MDGRNRDDCDENNEYDDGDERKYSSHDKHENPLGRSRHHMGEISLFKTLEEMRRKRERGKSF